MFNRALVNKDAGVGFSYLGVLTTFGLEGKLKDCNMIPEDDEFLGVRGDLSMSVGDTIVIEFLMSDITLTCVSKHYEL